MSKHRRRRSQPWGRSKPRRGAAPLAVRMAQEQTGIPAGTYSYWIPFIVTTSDSRRFEDAMDIDCPAPISHGDQVRAIEQGIGERWLAMAREAGVVRVVGLTARVSVRTPFFLGYSPAPTKDQAPDPGNPPDAPAPEAEANGADTSEPTESVPSCTTLEGSAEGEGR